MSKNHLFLGVTRNRGSRIKYECNPPINNGEFECGIVILNRETLEFEKFINLEEVFKRQMNIFEIRLINERDYAIHLDSDNVPLSLDLI